MPADRIVPAFSPTPQAQSPRPPAASEPAFGRAPAHQPPGAPPAIEADSLVVPATPPGRSATPPTHVLATPQAPPRRRRGPWAQEAIARIQRAHIALSAAGLSSAQHADTHAGTGLSVTPNPGARGPSSQTLPSPSGAFPARILAQATEAYRQSAQALQAAQHEAPPPFMQPPAFLHARPAGQARLAAGDDPFGPYVDPRLTLQPIRADASQREAVRIQIRTVVSRVLQTYTARQVPHTAIVQALQDVASWHAHLPADTVVHLTPAQAQTHRCLISHLPFDELMHPVGVYTGDVLHVFEGEDLLTWMRHQTEPHEDDDLFVHKRATHPLSRQPLPLETLRRVQLHTTPET